MTIRGLRYAIVLARDYASMKSWYRNSLQLEIADEDEAGQWATFRFPDGVAELAIHGGAPMPETAGRTPIVPCMEVADINRAVEELRSRGVNFVRDVHEGAGGTVLLANFQDPEGNLLQLYQRAGGM